MSATPPPSESLIAGVDFVSVPVRDLDASIAFYRDVLGLPLLVRYTRELGAELQAGELTLQLIDAASHGRDFQANEYPIALRVDDERAARAALQERGVRFPADTVDNGVCRQSLFRDPDGNRLMLHERYRPR